MPSTPASCRSQTSFILFIVLVSLLSLSIHRTYLGLDHRLLEQPLKRRQTVSPAARLDVTTSDAIDISPLNSLQNLNTNFSYYQGKRACGKDDFWRFKHYGDVVYENIQAAFSGCDKLVREFEVADVANGWTAKGDASNTINPHWAGVFGPGIPPKEQVSWVLLKQDQPFTNNEGTKVEVPACIGVARTPADGC